MKKMSGALLCCALLSLGVSLLFLFLHYEPWRAFAVLAGIFFVLTFIVKRKEKEYSFT
jgi:hypothetical protein